MHITSSTFPNWNDTEQTRIVRQKGDDRLTWENAAASAGGQVVLVFERVK